MLCIFFLIQKLKNNTLKSTFGEINRARERFSGERKRAPARSVERERGGLRPHPARESVYIEIRRKRAFPA
jgi:hypothetical protein